VAVLSEIFLRNQSFRHWLSHRRQHFTSDNILWLLSPEKSANLFNCYVTNRASHLNASGRDVRRKQNIRKSPQFMIHRQGLQRISYINVARGGLSIQKRFWQSYALGRLTAALDVTDPLEPLPVDHELRRLPNVLLTPHIAAGGIEMRRAIGDIAVEEVCRFFRGGSHRMLSLVKCWRR